MSRLVVGYPMPLPTAPDGRTLIDEKLRSGVVSYRERWPGGDVVLATPDGAPGTAAGLGVRAWSTDELGFEIVTGPTWRDAVDRAAGDLHLLPLLPRTSEVEHVLHNSVLTVEFTPEDLASTERRGLQGLVSRARVEVGSRRRRRTYEAWVRRARGIQCNGYPAYNRFAELSASALLFFDTRLTDAHVRAARGSGRTTVAPPFRLCFSGRLIDGKGPQHAVAVADLLRARGIDVVLDVIGVGPLEAELRRSAGPGVEFRAGMDFAEGWTAYVREQVDLMVLPHTQGDPSGTYLESVGCGVPVVGFGNVALAALVAHHGIGLAVPLDDDKALADAAASVLTDPTAWAHLRANGLDFMEQHTFEREADRRIAHLVSLCG